MIRFNRPGIPPYGTRGSQVGSGSGSGSNVGSGSQTGSGSNVGSGSQTGSGSSAMDEFEKFRQQMGSQYPNFGSGANNEYDNFKNQSNGEMVSKRRDDLNKIIDDIKNGASGGIAFPSSDGNIWVVTYERGQFVRVKKNTNGASVSPKEAVSEQDILDLIEMLAEKGNFTAISKSNH